MGYYVDKKINTVILQELHTTYGQVFKPGEIEIKY